MIRAIIATTVGLIALTASYVTGVNNGYDLGADTMQCVIYSSLDLEDKSIESDACEPTLRWSKRHPAVVVRVTWINVTGQSIPSGYIKTGAKP